MTNYEYIASLSQEEMADWLLDNGRYEDAPWDKYFCEKYCDNCECLMKKTSPKLKEMFDWIGDETEVGYCEEYNKCRFFPELDDVPDPLAKIAMWLKASTDD